jgi:hypothetical protein
METLRRARAYDQDGMSRRVIEEVRVYTRTLSASETSTDYNNCLIQSRMAVTTWQLDGVDQNLARHGLGMPTISSISISKNRTVSLASTLQYYLVISGGSNVTLSQIPPTGDSFYDSESTLAHA